MDSLSYLIENNNQVIIDEKLLQELQQKNQPLPSEKYQIKTSPSTENLNKIQASKGIKKYSPMNRNLKRSPQQSNTILKTQTAKSNLTPQSRLFNEEESINILTSKIQSLKQGQKQMQDKYGSIINNLRNELNKRNTQYEQQCEQFNQIKAELTSTKKDIASLIGLLKRTSTKQGQNGKKILSPNAGKNTKGNVLGGFSKSSKNIL